MSSPVMHVITNFTSSAGAETMLARLLRKSTNDRILVVSLIGISDRNKDLANNARAIYTPLGIRHGVELIPGTIRLARMISREKPKVIVCWMYHAINVATVARSLSRSNVPIVWNIRQSLDDPASLSRSTRLALTLARTLSSTPSGIIYNSERAMKLHQTFGYDNSRAKVITNGFEIPEIPKITAKSPGIFGIAGRFHPQKDHSTFFKAASIVFQKFPHIHFKAVGAGLSATNPAVAKLLVDSGLPIGAIELCGESSDMPSYYNSIDVLVLSSRTEGFPNVVAEAMSYGKPVITTDVGDAATIVNDTGWVTQPRNPVSLADAISNVLNLSPAEYACHATRARDRINSLYRLDDIADKYERFLEYCER